MFGYVRPPLEELPQEEYLRFRKLYCGLCHTLEERYGQAARFVLNFDFTFLAILLWSGEESVDAARCYASPLRKREYQKSAPSLSLAADESVILAYWQLQDGVNDHGALSGLPYRAGAGALRSAYEKAAALRPEFDESVRRQLQILERLERESCSSIDQAADAFAVLLSCAAEEVENGIHRRVLRQMLYHLGRWVYLVDAADDLAKDAAAGNYNPVALRYGLKNGIWEPAARHEFALTLDHSIHMMATAYELRDFGVWSPILSSTIYTGLFRVGNAVLQGTFRKKPGKKERKISKEETI